ncbi:MAG: UbiA prenyltransferase family protein [Kiritimatiellia bacterium]
MNSQCTYHKSAKPQQPRNRVARTFGESAEWSEHQGPDALYGNGFLDLLRTLRIGQWPKNLLLLAAPFFAWFDPAQKLQAKGIESVAVSLTLAVGAFCLLSAASYIVNDLRDRPRDAVHPLRRVRPIAARKVSFGAALVLTLLCFAGGAGLAWLTHSIPFMVVCAAYVILQPLYTFLFRRVEGLAVLALATGFVLRAVGGAEICDVRVSPWLLLCVFLVALFVALCKRRSEHFLRPVPETRVPSPSAADQRILDLEIGVSAASVIACYALYTLATETIALYHTDRLVYTLPIVVFGVFRYLRLTYGENRAGTPERVFTRDPLMLTTLIVWLFSCAAILWMAGSGNA